MFKRIYWAILSHVKTGFPLLLPK